MSIDGTYDLKMKTPMGPQTGKLIVSAKDGILSGHMEQMGNVVELQDGTIADNGDLSFSAKMKKPMPLTMSAEGQFDGTSITGNIALGPFGKATFEATPEG